MGVEEQLVALDIKGQEENKDDNKSRVKKELMTLLYLLPRNSHKACQTARDVIKSIGVKRFQKLTGLHHMNCGAKARTKNTMPVSRKSYEKLAKLLSIDLKVQDTGTSFLTV